MIPSGRESSIVRPQSFSLECDNLPEYSYRLRGPWELVHEQLSPGDAGARANGIIWGKNAIYHEFVESDIRFLGQLHPGSLVLAIPDDASRLGSYWGKPCPSSSLVYFDSHREIDISLKNLSGSMVVLNEEEFMIALDQAGGLESLKLKGHHYLQLLPQRLSHLRNLWAGMAETSLAPSDFSISQYVAESLAQCAPISSGRTIRSRKRTSTIKELVDLWERGEMPLSLRESSLQLGINQRTLSNWFKMETGLPPHQYLLRRRLNLAYSQLLQATPLETSVADIAFSIGFTELGRFAGRFRQLFGCLPSQVLRQIPPPGSHWVQLGNAA
ncbi:AraC-like DNA-binding protein [Haloferula luteola]|uniref:AraC-like DNA-binding protein n=1 Tax=Haloferula luteola TaxID=595692 RepID=A0A840V417_9BACT|nr:AraC family transcriptional regulator [Haloferula luteola]MBB5352273.1 AraC-like DNA-binding protein [Haloferula luteola]